MPIPFTLQPNCLRTHSLHLFCCSHRLAGLHVTCARLAALARPGRTSISRMSSKEKITLHEREKHPPPALQTPPTEEEEEEPNAQSRPGAPSKASSSSSSEEESESESDAESGEHYKHYSGNADFLNASYVRMVVTHGGSKTTGLQFHMQYSVCLFSS